MKENTDFDIDKWMQKRTRTLRVFIVLGKWYYSIQIEK